MSHDDAPADRVTIRTRLARVMPRRLLRMRRTTVPIGIALGAFFVAALIFVGAVGIDPLPGFEISRPDRADGDPRIATQPEVQRSLLDPHDLPPGYAVTPGAGPTGVGASATPGAPAGGESVGELGQVAWPGLPGTGQPEILPGVPLGGLPLDHDVLGELPLDDALGEDLLDGDGSASSGPGPTASGSAEPAPGTPEAGAVETEGPGNGEATPDHPAPIYSGPAGPGPDGPGPDGPGPNGPDFLFPPDRTDEQDPNGRPAWSGDGSPTGGRNGPDRRTDSGPRDRPDRPDRRNRPDRRVPAHGSGGSLDGTTFHRVDRPHGTADKHDALCRILFSAPWVIAASGLPSVAPSQAADYSDRRRDVRLLQVLGGFAGNGAERAMARVRRTAQACPHVRIQQPSGREGSTATVENGPASGRLPVPGFTVTMAPLRSDRPAGSGSPGSLDSPGSPTGASGPDDAYAIRFVVRTDDGRIRSGYLALDRVGPVLSVLWHLGPGEVITPGEMAATCETAVSKVRPLARLLETRR